MTRPGKDKILRVWKMGAVCRKQQYEPEPKNEQVRLMLVDATSDVVPIAERITCLFPFVDLTICISVQNALMTLHVSNVLPHAIITLNQIDKHINGIVFAQLLRNEYHDKIELVIVLSKKERIPNNLFAYIWIKPIQEKRLFLFISDLRTSLLFQKPTWAWK